VQEATLPTNRMLMRRYAAIHKAKDADVFGIVVGTLGVCKSSAAVSPFHTEPLAARYLPLIDRLKSLLRSRRKKVYTLCVGKPTPSKLGNYQEVECFVLVACPENSLLLTSPDESKQYIRPIVSPWELEVALGTGPTWEQGWRVGWDTTAPEAVDGVGEEEDEMQFSAATGQLRTVRRFGNGPGTSTTRRSHCIDVVRRESGGRPAALGPRKSVGRESTSREITGKRCRCVHHRLRVVQK
jgi:diphthamide biosynthesis protein 2